MSVYGEGYYATPDGTLSTDPPQPADIRAGRWSPTGPNGEP
jgi:hypothetical protein